MSLCLLLGPGEWINSRTNWETSNCTLISTTSEKKGSYILYTSKFNVEWRNNSDLTNSIGYSPLCDCQEIPTISPNTCFIHPNSIYYANETLSVWPTETISLWNFHFWLAFSLFVSVSFLIFLPMFYVFFMGSIKDSNNRYKQVEPKFESAAKISEIFSDSYETTIAQYNDNLSGIGEKSKFPSEGLLFTRLPTITFGFLFPAQTVHSPLVSQTKTFDSYHTSPPVLYLDEIEDNEIRCVVKYFYLDRELDIRIVIGKWLERLNVSQQILDEFAAENSGTSTGWTVNSTSPEKQEPDEILECKAIHREEYQGNLYKEQSNRGKLFTFCKYFILGVGVLYGGICWIGLVLMSYIGLFFFCNPTDGDMIFVILLFSLSGVVYSLLTTLICPPIWDWFKNIGSDCLVSKKRFYVNGLDYLACVHILSEKYFEISTARYSIKMLRLEIPNNESEPEIVWKFNVRILVPPSIADEIVSVLYRDVEYWD